MPSLPRQQRRMRDIASQPVWPQLSLEESQMKINRMRTLAKGNRVQAHDRNRQALKPEPRSYLQVQQGVALRSVGDLGENLSKVVRSEQFHRRHQSINFTKRRRSEQQQPQLRQQLK